MKNITSIFNQLGLTHHEGVIYKALLEYGPVAISDIAAKTGLYRPSVYKSLESLLAKNLILRVPQGKRSLYTAENPAKLQELAKQLFSEVTQTVDELQELYTEKDRMPTIRVLEGREGVRAVFADVVETLPKGATFYRYTSEKNLNEVNKYLPKEYRKKRDAKRLERLVISNTASGSQKKPRLERWIKYIPQDFDPFQQNIIQLIYGKRVAIIDMTTKNSLIMENAAFADFQEKIFKLLYKKL